MLWPMDERERRAMLQMLDRTRDEFLASLNGVSDAQARWRPAPDQWSVLDCAEHVAVAERGMLHLITELASPRAAAGQPGREEQVVAATLDRSRQISAPQPVRPRGRFATLAEAADRFRSNRQATAAFVATCEIDLRTLEVQHPVSGLLTANECLSVLAAHPSRHAAQVRGIRARPDFPRSEA
jgi:hypothetical protein